MGVTGIARKLRKLQYRDAAGWTLLALVAVAFICSFLVGRYPVAPADVITVLAGRLFSIGDTLPETVKTVVLQVRLPRVAAAMLVGASLAASGAAYQGMFRNPLVSPDILGVSAGAGFGASLAIFLSLGVIAVQISAFTFGLLAVLITCFIGTGLRNSNPTIVLVLVGVLVGTLFSSMTSVMKYLADPYDKLPAITFWLMGSLASATSHDVLTTAFPILAGLIPLHLVRWRLNVLSLGEDEAQALGVNTRSLRAAVILCSTLVTASAVSITGIIGWVGLVVPHLARMVVGPNYRALLPASLLMGSCYLLLVDDLARALAPVEIPLGILTSVMGAPIFILLLHRTRQGWI